MLSDTSNCWVLSLASAESFACCDAECLMAFGIPLPKPRAGPAPEDPSMSMLCRGKGPRRRLQRQSHSRLMSALQVYSVDMSVHSFPQAGSQSSHAERA